MSELTDLFTNMANKIRANLGTSDTYSPAEAITAIDDVYDAGYSEGYSKGKTTHTLTYTISAKSSSSDMGESHSYRYVNTSGVPNSNSGIYSFPANSTGATVDMGETNSYRNINASNVYSKGRADSYSTATSTSALTIRRRSTVTITCAVGSLIVIGAQTTKLTVTGLSLLGSSSTNYGGATSYVAVYTATATSCTIKSSATSDVRYYVLKN